MTDTKTLIVVATGLYGKIARSYENLMKVGESKITLGVVDARLQNLEKLWEKFDAINYTFAERVKEIEREDYAKQDVPALGEEAYLTNKALMLDMKAALQLRQQASQQAASSAVAAAPAPATRSTLPKIQPPPFTGKYEDWPSFRDLFQSIIDKNPEAKPVDKLHYLKLCVKGDAESLIRPLTTTDENYEVAWQTLSNYYENKRLLTRHYIDNCKALPKMKSESPEELKRIFHGLKMTYNSLKSIGRPINRTEDFFVDRGVELLDARTRRHWEEHISDSTDFPAYATLEAFIERRLHTLEALFPNKADSSTKHNHGGSKTTRTHHARKQETKEKPRGRCSACQGDHFVMFCEDYKKKSAIERRQHVADNQLCTNCLGRHTTTECSSKKTCSACGKRHHSSLHDAFREPETVKTSHVAQPLSPPTAVLLATARVRVSNRNGIWLPARALVDQGSESSIVSERLMQLLKLPRSAASVSVFGVGGRKTGVSKGKAILTLQSLDRSSSISVEALILPKLTIFAGGYNGEGRPWPHLQGLELADPDYRSSDQVDLLLGADAYANIICQGLKKGKAGEPIAQRTTLGWILSGSVGETAPGRINTYHCQVEDDLTGLVRRFWEQEELQGPRQPLSKADQECEEHFRRHHSRAADGRYIMRLPTIEALPDLSATRRAACRALQHVNSKFTKADDFRSEYIRFMKLYLDLNHMKPAPSSSAGPPQRACYLPHHGVLRESSTTTKLRVVFNGSSSLPNGDSLNRFLMTGPNLLPALADILLRWRRHRYVFSTDIEKMYRQILVHTDDQGLQRILWREDTHQEIKEYLLTTVTYGLSCAPYLAIRTLHQLADDGGRLYPAGAAVLRSDVYMDDILSGADSLSEAQEILRQLVRICEAGGFPLKKWSANHSKLLDTLPSEDCLQQNARWWLPGESHPTLGLRWQPCDDHFSFAASQISLSTITKRSVLSLTARLFDPMGWLSPTTVLAKIQIQSTWLLGIDWDTPLPEDDVRSWRRFQAELPHLKRLQVPRWFGGGVAGSSLEVHGFADASVRAYAAVVYLRSEKEGDPKVTLVAAKTKVAPLKQISLPRLELSAATLLVRLIRQCLPHIGAEKAPIHLWSDSTVTLGWIRGHPSSWTTFVANRVSEIQTSLPSAAWHHIPGRDNPADCASRGVFPGELPEHPLWWQGPPWLREESRPWEMRKEDSAEDELPERRTRSHAATQAPDREEPELLLRYSSLQRLLRVTAWCLRWLRARRRQPPRDSNCHEISADELHEARLHWLRVIQAVKFQEELKTVRGGKPLPARSSLYKLTPFLDEAGILRVGGRLRHSPLTYDANHSIILPSSSRFTHLVIEAHHQQTLHGGVQLTLCSIRQEYWIPRGRSLVKGHLHSCVKCQRWRAATSQPMMGDLPAPRVTPGRAFLHTGIDYAGPVWLKTSKGRGHRASKAFIAVFVCLGSRAIHLDVVSDYSADAFLASLRRFIARRGVCHTLYSDCGTNFVGADSQLRDLFSAASTEGRRIATFAAQERIRWRFNPPAAPNFGGIWEAAVKAMKHHLRRVIGEATLTYEEMATLLCQVEACLNSRPLQPLTDDPEDLAALTPGHFIIGSALSAVPEPSLEREPSTRLSRWQLLQKMRDHFWSRWSSEYLNTLAHRPKWSRIDREARVGRLCLVRNEVTPPSRWPLARITKLHPGSDGHVRVVEIRTATTVLTRPVNKLVFLPDGTKETPENKTEATPLDQD